MKARVLIVFGSIPLFGHERANIAVFDALKDCGIDSLFATNVEWGAISVTPYLDRLGLKWRGVKFVGPMRRSMGLIGWAKALWGMAKGSFQLARLIRQYDPTHVYLTNESFFVNVLPALMASHRTLVYRVGDSPQQHRASFRFLWRHVLARRVNRFVCVSHFIGERLALAGVPREKLRVIYTYPAARGAPTESDAAIPSRWHEGFTVAYAGQLTADKGVDVLVEAALALCESRKDIRFLIAGDYTWKNPFAAALMACVARSGASERIRFLGMIEAVPRLLEVSDAHACPSVWEEPLANIVIEAKAAGIPSIVFPVGGLGEVVEHMVDGYMCKTRSAEALAEAITFLADNRDACRRMGEAAKAGLQRRFGLERFRREWLEVFS
jgi:glycosyltransferase involved in cell wall biosynthesis